MEKWGVPSFLKNKYEFMSVTNVDFLITLIELMGIFPFLFIFLHYRFAVYWSFCVFVFRVWDLDGNDHSTFRLFSPGISVCWHPQEVFKVKQ